MFYRELEEVVLLFQKKGQYINTLNNNDNTGFYGTLYITSNKGNENETQSKDIYAQLYYNNNPLTNEITISYSNTEQLEVSIADRLPNPSSILTLRLRCESGITNISLGAFTGFTIAGFTANPLTENNYASMLVNSEFINGGALSITFVYLTLGT
jgi:hypothetical protein